MHNYTSYTSMPMASSLFILLVGEQKTECFEKPVG